MELTDAELGYTAGILDGEGSIQIDRRSDKNFGATIVVAMKNQAIPLWLEQHFGGRINSYKQSKMSYDSSGYMTQWRIHGVAAQEFIRQIRPYMIEKAERADVLLSFPVGNHYGADKEVQECLYWTMKMLQDKSNKGNRRPR